jgi:uncharacterized protein
MNRKLLNKTKQKLDELYKQIPVTIKCQGLCQESCGPIAMTEVEFERISETSGTTPCINESGICSLLKDGKCSVYSIRPVICRLFGLIESMKCPFGCVPTPRYLTKEEGFKILSKADEITGHGKPKATLPELENFLNAVPR